MKADYDPSCFDVSNIRSAKAIILTPEDASTERRWAIETPYFGSLIMDHLNLQHHHRVLDYGCGIGRVAKEIIARSGCMVLGVDTSVGMRSLAPAYVENDRFIALSPQMMPVVVDAHYAISVWTLQHVPDLVGAIEVIYRKLHPGGMLLVINLEKRALPMSRGAWIDDGADVREFLGARFEETHYGRLDPASTTPATATASFLGVYQRRN